VSYRKGINYSNEAFLTALSLLDAKLVRMLPMFVRIEGILTWEIDKIIDADSASSVVENVVVKILDPKSKAIATPPFAKSRER
jgi:hypothetical protein